MYFYMGVEERINFGATDYKNLNLCTNYTQNILGVKN
jgi:hypothetical protein